jgi:peptide chain release factor subunit 1
VYLDLDPTRFPTAAARDAQVGSLLDQARREAGEHDAERVRGWLEVEPTIMRGARGLAIFSSTAADILEAVRLPTSVEPLAVVDTIPWLEPLAAMISPGNWGVAVVSRRGARLLRGGPDGLTEFATIDVELHRRHAQGGWSQARFQRGIEEQVAAHVRGVADRLLRAHRRRPFEQLVIVCSGELRPAIERSLPSELTEVLAGSVDADLEHASAAEIAVVVGHVIDPARRNRERDLIVQLEQALGTGGAAAAGLDEVLSMLNQQRVDTLLVSERGSLKGGRCPTCGRLSSDGGGRCPVDGSILIEIDAIEHAVAKAVTQSARVVIVDHEQAWLHEHGEIAALLRW